MAGRGGESRRRSQREGLGTAKRARNVDERPLVSRAWLVTRKAEGKAGEPSCCCKQVLQNNAQGTFWQVVQTLEEESKAAIKSLFFSSKQIKSHRRTKGGDCVEKERGLVLVGVGVERECVNGPGSCGSVQRR